MQSSSYLMVLKQNICVLIYKQQTNPGPQVTVLSLMKVFMYQINENCHETYLNIIYWMWELAISGLHTALRQTSSFTLNL